MAISTISTLSDEQKQLASALGTYLLSNVGQGATAYTGQLTAGLSSAEQAAYNKALENLNSGLSSSAQSSVNAYNEAIKGLSAEEVYKNYMKYTAPQEYKYLTETSIPTYKESMVPGGTLRSTGTEKGIADVISNYQNTQLSNIGEAINAARSNAVSALSNASSINALENQTSDIEQAASLGATSRAVEQAELTAKLEEFIRTSPESSSLIDKMLSYLGVTTTAAYNTSSTSSSTALLSSLASLIGSAAAGSA